MSDSGGSFRPLSGASLGLDPADRDAALEADRAGPFDASEDERYVEGGVLGRGGMGEVRSAHDSRLNRTVAVKKPVRHDPAAERRLVAEATLTARLAHPGIVSIHDAGRGRDGRPFYTMPVVRGRSLAEAIAGARLEARLRLVRHFLDACEAVAYAHSEGLLHRDLKPANILVGRFGETLVVDWGLAGPIGERPGLTAVVGTPAYMAPEQARGERLEATADVYALGVTLRELVYGVLPGGEAGAADARRDTRHWQASAPGRLEGTRTSDGRQRPDGESAAKTSGGSPRPAGETAARPVDPELPSELLAIVERATRERPADRYPDARALADDVAAWFEGRRVAAHRYTLREVLARVWSAHRVSIVAALLAVLGIAAATAIGIRRTAVEHDRAREAEKTALEARARSDRHLALAEVAQALQAMARDNQADVEVLAASALTLGESADARGMLARFDGAARPRLIRRMDLPECDRNAISVHGERVACAVKDVIHVIEPDQTPVRRYQITQPQFQMTFAGAGQAMLVDGPEGGLSVYRPDAAVRVTPVPSVSIARLFPSARDLEVGWIAGSRERFMNLATGEVQTFANCAELHHMSVLLVGIGPSGDRVSICQNGAVMKRDATRAASFQTLLHLDFSKGIPLTIAFSDTGGRMALGLANGGAVVVDLQARKMVRAFEGLTGAVYDVALSGDRLALSDGQDTVTIWDVSTGDLVSRLDARRARVAWVGGDRRLRVMGRSLEDWEMPASSPRPHLHSGGSGISALSISPDGQLVAAAHGDGYVRLHRLDRVAPLGEVKLHWSVVKDVEFSPDGKTLAAVCAQDQHLFLIDRFEAPRVQALPGACGMRLAWFRGDMLVLAPYLGGLLAWKGGVPVSTPLPLKSPRIVDIEADADRDAATLRAIDGRIMRMDAGLGGTSRVLAEREASNGVAGRPGRMVFIHESELEVVDADGRSQRIRLPGAGAGDVAISPDGTKVAVGHLDGSVSVWRADRLERLAVLRGHTDRVSAVAFDRSGTWLVSGSWDGDLRTWSMRPLDAPPEALLREARTAWGRTLEDVLYVHTDDGP